jgi:hypothetical protein
MEYSCNKIKSKYLTKFFFSAILISCLIYKAKAQDQIIFTRSKNNPIITSKMLKNNDGENINGPSLIKVPDWVSNKLGKYYLYFAHHKGNYIRMAYANHPEGPWKIYEPGTLQLKDCKACVQNEIDDPAIGIKDTEHGKIIPHIASPDVHIDSIQKKIVMYFHCPAADSKYYEQLSLRAVSDDGIHFKASAVLLGPPYFRVFKWKGNYYALARRGSLLRSKDGISSFDTGGNPFSWMQTKNNYLRHSAVKLRGNTLLVFYSRIGDTPEKILVSKIELKDNWENWRASKPMVVSEPVTEYEGCSFPVKRSVMGKVMGGCHELRDPCIYEEGGKWYLLYSISGENGIAIGELKIK